MSLFSTLLYFIAVPVKETPESKYTLEQLLDKAQELVDQYEYSLAQKFVQRALETNSDDVRALELAATLFIEVRSNH